MYMFEDSSFEVETYGKLGFLRLIFPKQLDDFLQEYGKLCKRIS